MSIKVTGYLVKQAYNTNDKGEIVFEGYKALLQINGLMYDVTKVIADQCSEPLTRDFVEAVLKQLYYQGGFKDDKALEDAFNESIRKAKDSR